MRKFLLILCALLGTVGAMATDVTVIQSTSDATTYGSLSGTTFTTNAASGIAGVTVEGIKGTTATNFAYGACLSLTSTASGTISMTAPEGYVIMEYSLTARSNTYAVSYTLTPSAGGTAVTTSTGGVTLTAKGLDAKTASFTYSANSANSFYIPSLVITIGTSEEAEFAKTQVEAYNTVQGWITTIQSSKGLVTDAANYISNAKSSAEGSYAALLDGEYTTYYHGAYGNEGPDEDQYLQATLSQPVDAFYFYYKKRSQNNNNRPTSITISGSNDGTTFTDVTIINSGLPTDASVIDYASAKINLGAAYQYIRFTVTATNNGAQNQAGHVFFTFSEFYMLPSNTDIDNVMTLYSTLAGTNAVDYTSEQIAQVTAANNALMSTLVNVTYNLYEADGTTLVDTKVVEQEKNSTPTNPFTVSSYFTYAITGTIGTEDCTITITRTPNAGIVYPISNLSNSKSYYIYTRNKARGGLSTYTDGETTYLASPVKSALGIEAKKFAILSYEDNYYLYSVDDQKFVTYNAEQKAPLAATVTGTTDRIAFSATTNPLYELRFDGSTSKIVNSSASYTYGVVMNGWGATSSQWDDGCQYTIEEAEDFDATAALAALEEYFHPAAEVVFNDAIAQLEAINWGSGLNHYSLTGAAAGYAGNEAAIISGLKAQGYSEDNLTVAQGLLANYALNIPAAGFYRIKGNTSGKYLAAGFASNNKFAMTDATDATTIFYFDGYQLINLSSGYSNGMSTSAWAWVLGENASTVEFQDGQTNGGYAIKSYNAYFYDGGTSADRGSSLGSQGQYRNWYLEEITTLPVTISAAGYATLCAPVALTIPEGVTANTVTINADGEHLDLAPVSTTIPAGTPVILSGENGEAAALGSYNFAITADVDPSNAANVLTGVYAAIEAPNNSYILQNQSGKVGFYQVDYTYLESQNPELSKPNVPGFRAYIPATSNPVKAFYFEDATDAINDVFEGVAASEIYNLAGQRISKLQKGVNIVNGKKVLVK